MMELSNTATTYQTILPGQTIGIIGGGQLARMMALEAKAMGYKVITLEPTPNCPCAQVCDMQITAAYDDMDAIKKLAELSDVITYEFENIDYEALTYLEKNAHLPQGSYVLKTTQHRFREKSAIKNMGIPVPNFHLVPSLDELNEIVFYPSVLKTTTLGYDGKGQAVLKSEADFPSSVDTECILEEWMPFSKEVSVIVCRSVTGETSVFPVSENIHVNNILHLSIVPARISKEVEAKAINCARKIAEDLNAIGLLAIEMFVVNDEIYINELAPRPHNSGHYTIDSCTTSQFEQHVRAVCALPLGEVKQYSPVVMVNILGQHMKDLTKYLPMLKNGKLHLYGKADAVHNRKMGHVNLIGNIDESLETIEKSGIWNK